MPSFRAALSKSGGKWKLQKTHGSGRLWIIYASTTDELVNQLKDTIKREEIMSKSMEKTIQIPIEDLKIDGTAEEFARIDRALRGEDFDKAESYRRVFTQLSNGKSIDPVLVHEDGVLMDGFHRTMLYKYMKERTGSSKYDEIPAVIVPREENEGVNEQMEDLKYVTNYKGDPVGRCERCGKEIKEGERIVGFNDYGVEFEFDASPETRSARFPVYHKECFERSGLTSRDYDRLKKNLLIRRKRELGELELKNEEKTKKEVDIMDKYDIYQAEVERIQNQESNGELDECIKKKVADGMEREKAIEECRGKSKGNGNANDND